MKDKEIYDSYPNVSVSLEVRFFLDDSFLGLKQLRDQEYQYRVSYRAFDVEERVTGDPGGATCDPIYAFTGAKLEKIQLIPLEELKPFREHPFKVQNDAEMERIVESVRKVGVISPGLARPLKEGGYELVSGHRRLAACRQAGLETMPVLVREMTDDEAVIAMCARNEPSRVDYHGKGG